MQSTLTQTNNMPQYLPWVGIDALLADHHRVASLKRKRVGLISNQASLTSQFIPSAYAIQNVIGPSLVCLFTLEHGWSAFCPAGDEVGNDVESSTKLPTYSLYGSLFKENVQRMRSLDCLIIDIQDIGVRCYTYAATCAKVIEYAAQEQYQLEVIICDRPNPLGTAVRGPCLDPAYRSLVSYIDVPFQHGKTIGSLLGEHNNRMLDLIVIPTLSTFAPMSNVWIPPSPGLPDWESVLLYPGLVLLEGTNVSEGRGSSLPFKCVAAPELDAMTMIDTLNAISNNSMIARPFTFVPTAGKLSGQLCPGAQIHIIEPERVDGFALGVHILCALFKNYPLFEWTRLEQDQRYWIDMITGSSLLRTAITEGSNPQDILTSLS